MSRAWHDQQMLIVRRAVRIVFVPHVAGDEAVVPAMNQQHRNVAMRQRIRDRGGLRSKPPNSFPPRRINW